MKKRILIILAASLFVVFALPGVFFVTAQEAPAAPTVRAMYCNSCGFGNKKNDCVKCGKWVGSSSFPAYLCNSCGFGNKKNDCVKCGKWIGGSGIPAVICGSCGFGNQRNQCVKCGK